MIKSHDIPSPIMTPETLLKLINFVIFQCIWFACVLGGNEYIALSIALIALHFTLSTSRKRDLQVLAAVTMIGGTCDLILSLTGLLVFDTPLIPLWLIVIWSGFSLTLTHSLAWLSRSHKSLQAGLGAIGGSASYFAGYKLEAVSFTYDVLPTLGVIFILWGSLIPLFYLMVNRYAHA